MDKNWFKTKLSTSYTNRQLYSWLLNLPISETRDKFLELTKKDLDSVNDIVTLTDSDLDKLVYIIAPNKPISKPISKPTIVDTPEQKIKIKPTLFKKGDVLLHNIFRHPYVLLEYKNDEWICGLLTSDECCAENLIKCNSRFFSEAYITKILFTTKIPTGRFLSVYDNASQLRAVYKKLKNIL